MIKPVLLVATILAIIVLASIAFIRLSVSSQSDVTTSSFARQEKTSTAPVAQNDTYSAREDSQSNVDVTAIPKSLGSNGKNTVFEIAFDTHSVELDYDFAEIMTLTDNEGTEYRALEWTGGRGSHHLSGDIIFPPLDVNAVSVTLSVKGVSGVDREFQWNIR